MEDNNFMKHPVLKYVVVALLVFLGAFSAFYVAADMHFKKMLDPVFQMQKIDRALMKQERQFNKMMESEFDQANRFGQNTAQFIHIDKTPDNYRIIIDLKPFDNNEKNVEVKTEGRTLSINASGENNRRNKHEVLKYSQTFNFGNNADLENITKVRQGSSYIITVPVEE